MHARRNAIGLLWISALLTAAAPALAEGVRGTLVLSFTGSSTLHDFEGTADPVAVSLSQDANGSWSADVSVPVAALETGNRWRDRDLREMLGAPLHPVILGRFRDLDPNQVRSSGVLPFLLRIQTVERPVQASVSHWRQSEREASFDAAFELSLESFQLKAPQTFFLRVADTVRVTVHVTLSRE